MNKKRSNLPKRPDFIKTGIYNLKHFHVLKNKNKKNGKIYNTLYFRITAALSLIIVVLMNISSNYENKDLRFISKELKLKPNLINPSKASITEIKDQGISGVLTEIQDENLAVNSDIDSNNIGPDSYEILSFQEDYQLELEAQMIDEEDSDIGRYPAFFEE
jgi:hypothetical protein